jgi:nucleoside-diphosphate-sugar epimerase
VSVDVRDVARAHVLALKLPPSSSSPKRFVLSTNTFTWKEAIELVAEKRPELKERLPVITGKETSGWAVRSAGHRQNGERAWDE